MDLRQVDAKNCVQCLAGIEGWSVRRAGVVSRLGQRCRRLCIRPLETGKNGLDSTIAINNLRLVEIIEV